MVGAPFSLTCFLFGRGVLTGSDGSEVGWAGSCVAGTNEEGGERSAILDSDFEARIKADVKRFGRLG